MFTLKQYWAWYLRIYAAFICSWRWIPDLTESTLISVSWKDALEESADIFLSSTSSSLCKAGGPVLVYGGVTDVHFQVFEIASEDKYSVIAQIAAYKGYLGAAMQSQAQLDFSLWV